MNAALEALAAIQEPLVHAYASPIADAANLYCPSVATPARFAVLLAGIGWRESMLGTSRDCNPKGEACTGDFTARRGRYLSRPGMHIVQDLPAGWHKPKDSLGEALPPPYAMPIDGLGFGRGIFQLDIGAHPDLCARVLPDGTPAWARVGSCADMAAELFASLMGRFAGHEIRALAAYNAGEGAVLHALAHGKDPDSATTGGNYARWILKVVRDWTTD